MRKAVAWKFYRVISCTVAVSFYRSIRINNVFLPAGRVGNNERAYQDNKDM